MPDQNKGHSASEKSVVWPFARPYCAPDGVVSAGADAELDDAAYDANMRSAASASLSEAADRFSNGSDHSSSIGDASDSDDADNDAEVVRDVMPRANAADGPAGSVKTLPHGEHKIAAQRTRSWDDSVEEGMAEIDADTPLGDDTDKRYACILTS